MLTLPLIYALYLSRAATTTTDSYGLLLNGWPPAPLKRILGKWVSVIDPLFGSGLAWVRAMIAMEVLLYPVFCMMACRVLRRGLHTARDAFTVASIVFATANSYSVLLLGAETLLGTEKAVRTPVVWMWLAAYLPFLCVPALFATRVWRCCARKKQ
jgi:hypothetical protein